MKFFESALKELYGLFVEDASFAIVTSVWLVIMLLVVPHMPFPIQWRAPVFVVGLLVILMENIVRTARIGRT